MSIVSISITAALSVLFYLLGLYGGADAKALIVISLSSPLSSTGIRYHPFTPLTVLLNGLLISLIIPIAMVAINLYRITVRREDLFKDFRHEKTHRKIMALFLGTVITNPRKGRFWASMEEFKGDWRFRFTVSIEEYWKPLRPGGWATPSIPLIIPIFVGLLLNYLIGDLSALMIKSLFS